MNAILKDQPCDFVLFGAKGDLSMRKLFPALYYLYREQLLHPGTRLVGVARGEESRDEFVESIKATLVRFVPQQDFDNAVWEGVAERLHYVQVDFAQAKDFLRLAKFVDQSERVMVNYLATPPALYGDICKHLHGANALTDTTRIILEKPIGHDLESSKLINDTVSEYFNEDRIYRIDHYLGKETVQNLIALRFANNLFGAQWNQNFIDHVQITVSETVGIEGRWSYYDKVGQMRDMVQNHLLQLLCMVAMDPPSQLSADGIRDEKLKVLRALRPITQENVGKRAVRGQYTSGAVEGQACPGYHEEEGSQGASNTETFVALRASIDNWRWAGVPFYLRTGKRMPTKMSEIVIFYRNQPHYIFDPKQKAMVSNKLIIRLQPDEGIRLQVVTKEQSLDKGMALQSRALNLNFSDQEDNRRIPDAYERLLLEAMRGNQSLFVRRDEVEASWSWCDALIQAWEESHDEVKPYSAGTWGPIGSIALIERDGRSWHE
ncbi:glucose-6-phosphate dehydrogenase [Motiliproteus coralliicola]|uniref:Glucose-6-phosphate 1-dehydrogenase n=1 Tax=Motiliproteus coralliicola TaxID=2283196 RepID=A0A369WY50_9GAMM|nr:glucose-6-phosphate dehydrogenase [Motiliproteus coralliicola]RDE24415.1 glucose-6-phosphate dehydrogenase [Motiliproteus coralliicola]